MSSLSVINSVITLHYVEGVSQVSKGFPCGVISWVTFPFDQILEAAAVESFVEDGLYLVLGFVLAREEYRGRRRACVSWEFFGGFLVFSEERHVEYRVDLQVGRKVQLVGYRGDDLRDLVGADVLGLKLLEGSLFLSGRIDVGSREEHFFSHEKLKVFAAFVRILGLPFLGGCEGVEPSCLPSGQGVLRTEVLQGGVVGDDREGASFQVDAPYLEGVYDGQ